MNADEVAAYSARLVERMSGADPNRVRALCRSIIAVEIDAAAGATHGRPTVRPPQFLAAVIEHLREQLDAATEPKSLAGGLW